METLDLISFENVLYFLIVVFCTITLFSQNFYIFLQEKSTSFYTFLQESLGKNCIFLQESYTNL